MCSGNRRRLAAHAGGLPRSATAARASRARFGAANGKARTPTARCRSRPASTMRAGTCTLEVGQLADLDRLLGTQLRGSVDGAVDFTPRAGRTHAQFQVDGKDLSAGRFSGAVHMAGRGRYELGGGAASRPVAESRRLPGASSRPNGAVNLDTHRVRIDQAAVDYRGQKFATCWRRRTISFADGLKIDQLELGAQNAVLRDRGRDPARRSTRAPRCSTSIRKLIGVFLPDLISEGTIEGNARHPGLVRRAHRPRQPECARHSIRERSGARVAGAESHRRRGSRGRYRRARRAPERRQGLSFHDDGEDAA